MSTKLQCMREKCNEEKEIHQTSYAIPCAQYEKKFDFIKKDTQNMDKMQ